MNGSVQCGDGRYFATVLEFEKQQGRAQQDCDRGGGGQHGGEPSRRGRKPNDTLLRWRGWGVLLQQGPSSLELAFHIGNHHCLFGHFTQEPAGFGIVAQRGRDLIRFGFGQSTVQMAHQLFLVGIVWVHGASGFRSGLERPSFPSMQSRRLSCNRETRL